MFLKQNLDKLLDWIDNYKSQILSVSLCVFFCLEIINRVYFYVCPDTTLSLSFYPKFFLQFVFIIPVISNYRILNLIEKSFLWFSLIFISIGIIRFSSDSESLIGGVKHFNKLLLPFYIYLFLEITKPSLIKPLRILDWIFILNSLLIIIGYIVSIDYLKSYPFSERFGYSGVFNRHAINDVSLFYLIGIFYMYFRWTRNYISWIGLLVVVTSSFLVGTKAIYLQSMCFFLFTFVTNKEYRKLTIVFSVVLLAIVFLSYNFNFWNSLLKEHGLLAVLTSNRTLLINERIPLVLKQLNTANVLFGLKNPFLFFVEMDLLDLLTTTGIIGTSLFVVFYAKILFNFKQHNSLSITFITLYLIMISISGHYMYSGLNCLYFSLFLYYIKQQEIIPQSN